MKILTAVTSFIFTIALAGCTVEVGSEKWCEALKEKPKGEWTLNEGKDFTKHCLLPK